MSSQYASPLPRHVTHDSGSVATTLTVASEPDSKGRAHADGRDTSNIGPIAGTKRGASWVVIGAALAAVAAVVALSRQSPTPPAPVVAAAQPVATSAAPPVKTSPAPLVLEAPAAASAGAPALSPNRDVAPVAALKPLLKSQGPARERTAASNNPTVLGLAASVTPRPSAEVPREAPTDTALGRSPEIERLIEQRR
jgi:hypothetical protein